MMRGSQLMARDTWLLPGLAMVLLLGIAGAQLWLLWQIRAGAFLRDGELEIRQPERAVTSGLAEVASIHLFGNAADKPPPEPEKPAALPVTDLKLVLVGAITDSDPAKASALISADNVVKRFYVGDDIQGQATLSEVAPDSVVLKRGLRYEKLQFPKGGEMNPEARESLARFTGKAPGRDDEPPPAAQPAVPPPPAVQSAPPADKPKTTGRSLREKLQRLPKSNQKAPGG